MQGDSNALCDLGRSDRTPWQTRALCDAAAAVFWGISHCQPAPLPSKLPRKTIKDEHSEVSGCLKERYLCNFNTCFHSVVAHDIFYPISSLLHVWCHPLHSLSQPCGFFSPVPSRVLPGTDVLTDAPYAHALPVQISHGLAQFLIIVSLPSYFLSGPSSASGQP